MRTAIHVNMYTVCCGLSSFQTKAKNMDYMCKARFSEAAKAASLTASA